MAEVLIADDEANLRKVLVALLKQDGHQATAVEDGFKALESLKKNIPDVLITDLKMPGMGGMELLRATREIDPDLPTIVITAHGSVDTAVGALKAGASDYITKPFDKDELKRAVRKVTGKKRGATRLPLTILDHQGRYQIVGNSKSMMDIYRTIEKVADSPSTVLITGESGTGKELIATALHQNSGRRNMPFIKVNCAAIPKDLLESEFFGYEQGAFTGAVNSKPGRFELAHGGTLFLDEIGEIPPSMQVKLLRALQESEFERVGGLKTINVNVRVIASTNRHLQLEIAEGTFREDLYYRLNVVPIKLPSLKNRRDDIALLASAFLEKFNERLKREIETITPEALATLTAYHWPGNIRELENVIERTVLFTDGTTIGIDQLPEFLRQSASKSTTQRESRKEVGAHDINNLETGKTSMRDIVRQATVEIERDLIIRALEATHGNVTRAANLLQISRKGLQNKMKEFGLREPETKA
ncbi:MAG: sigma-54 dependent transcriptional regulator [Myxococcota bacterium]|nr:sigma-54 dependent transcriptional regulator [Myxococcota bacterium]